MVKLAQQSYIKNLKEVSLDLTVGEYCQYFGRRRKGGGGGISSRVAGGGGKFLRVRVPLPPIPLSLSTGEK